METSENILETMKDEDEKKKQIQQQIDEELKKMKLKKSEGSSAAMSRELEAIGDNLKKNLDEIERYVQRRSTDRELLRNVRKMLANTYDFFKVDISRIIIE
jgi:DNA repair ATPase RecN